ncbi:hypothetical protein [Lonsdalea quercina]|uniref:hypothetical protein n=1 Tax=Lonsdalea quercina TaxID=71657 RepID=UPI0039760580
MATKNSRLKNVLPKVDAWASDSWPQSEWVNEYIAGGGSFAEATDSIFGLYQMGMTEVSNSLLHAQAGRQVESIRCMAHGFSRMLYACLTNIHSMANSKDFYISSLDSITHELLGAIATGQMQLVGPFYQVVLEALKNGYGIQDGHNPPLGTTLRYAAFGLTIIGDWLGKPIDLDKHALPRDPAWGRLVAHWREPDPEKFLPILLSACDTHIERIAVTEREANQQAKQFEFNSVFLAVHPTEILAVLRLRESLGLTNPDHIDHPLMQTPYAAITCQPGEVTERDELLDRFLEVVRQRDPQVLPPGI